MTKKETKKMTDYISRQAAIDALAGWKISPIVLDPVPSADVVEADKAQKEIDYWHDKAQSYEQTIMRLTLNKADVVEVVRCKDCVYREVKGAGMAHWFGCRIMEHNDDDWYCSYGERADT